MAEAGVSPAPASPRKRAANDLEVLEGVKRAHEDLRAARENLRLVVTEALKTETFGSIAGHCGVIRSQVQRWQG